MNAKTAIAGVVGGVVLFVWASISHMALGLGSVGFRSMANEEAVMETMRANVGGPGLYFFPWMDPAKFNDEAAMKEWEARAARGPAGLLIYQEHGENLSPRQLITEFVSNVIIGLLAALLVSQMAGGFGLRILAVGAMGLMAGMDIYVSYWNWYKFPTNYTLAVMGDELMGFLLMGAAIAAITRKK